MGAPERDLAELQEHKGRMARDAERDPRPTPVPLPVPSAVTTEYRLGFDESPVVDSIRGDREGGRIQIRVIRVRVTEYPDLDAGPAVEALGLVVKKNGERDHRYRDPILSATSVRRAYLEAHFLAQAGLR